MMDKDPLVPGLRSDDPDVEENICRHFQDPHQMDRFMNRFFGPGGWTFNEVGQVWIATNQKGPGVYVFCRGAHWVLLEAVS